jgi:cation:H+ antiporter
MVEALVLPIVLVVVSTVTIFVGSEWLEDASGKLAAYYDLPAVVQGGIVAAAGSSFPEFASVVFAAFAGSFDLGVGAIVGSAVFNVLVIPALSVLLSSGGMDSTRTLVHKETLFYMLAVTILFLTFALALIYNPTGESLGGLLTRPLMLVPLAGYGLYLFLQWQDSVDRGSKLERGTTSLRRQWGLLLLGLLVILGGVFVLVEAVLELGETFGVSEFLWGATVVAAATSLPDAVVSMQAAGKERDVTSISNVLGSNTFDLLVVIPVGILIVGTEPIDFAVTAPMMGALVGATIVLFVTLRTGLVLSTREAYVLLGCYVLFILWIVGEAAGVLTVLPS